ncbi:MAG: hypothetical protein ACTSUE_02585 [Promethearchaeota archaeon]
MKPASTRQFTIDGVTRRISTFLLERARLNGGETMTFLEWASKVLEGDGTRLVFLRMDAVFDLEILETAVYHALRTRFTRGITISKFFAIDVLMHYFCTTQINIIQKHLVPGDMNARDRELEWIVLVTITPAKEIETGGEAIPAAGVINGFRPSTVTLDELPGELVEHARSLFISRVLDAEPCGRGESWFNDTILSKMAQFSLELQMKFNENSMKIQ